MSNKNISNKTKKIADDPNAGMKKAIDEGFRRFLKKRNMEAPTGFNYSKQKNQE